MEYIWGLNIHTFNPTHERSILHSASISFDENPQFNNNESLEVRKSMVTPFPTGKGSWTLIPTEETLLAMDALQKHNIYAPIYARKSFLAVSYRYLPFPFVTCQLT